MWKAYHRLRSSKTFRCDWNRFLQSSIGHRAHPGFFQFVSHHILQELIKAEFPLPPATQSSEHPDRPLTFEEQNALRYVAGYVCRKVREDLESSSSTMKDDMIFCVLSLAGDETDEDGETEVWVNKIDRGGLWHISDSTYMLFAIMEEQIRRYFTTRAITQLRGDTKDQIHSALMNDDDILFQWSLLTAMVDDSVASKLLSKITQLYISVRGFAFVKSCVEMYKQNTKQTLQRKKSLRRELYSSKH